MQGAGIQIGETLRAARKRAGLDIASLEQRTHIRTRYLRALEDENWDELPDQTYARAFLRTYAEELGLDADALGDELRLRQGGRVGGAEELITPQPNGERPPSRWLVAALAAAIVLLLALLAFAGRSNEDEDGPAGAQRPGMGASAQGQSNGARGDDDRRGNDRAGGPRRAPLTLAPLTAARVCVVSGGRALVDRQILAAGNAERFARARRFRVDLEFGEVRLRSLEARTRIRADSAGSPLSVVVRPGQIRRVPYSGGDCP